MYETYYGLLKSGEIRQYEKKPKRNHVTVATTSLENSLSHETFHVVTCDGETKTLNAHCGYDRGPRLDNIIRGMLS